MLTEIQLKRLRKILSRTKRGREQARLLRMLVRAARRPAECLPWRGGRNVGGYGVVQFDGVTMVAHKVVWQVLYGPVPDSLLLNHLTASVCTLGRRCANPGHLEVTTSRVNDVKDSARPPAIRGRDPRCASGHRLIPRAEGRPLLWCPVCDADRVRELSGGAGPFLTSEQLGRFFEGIRSRAQSHFFTKLLEASEHPKRCVAWERRVDRWGYGSLMLGGVQGQAHRWMWQILVGPLPSPRQRVLNHKTHSVCKIGPRCLNPDHMESVTPGENAIRDSDGPTARNIRKTLCLMGHQLVRRKGNPRKRFCPICMHARREARLATPEGREAHNRLGREWRKRNPEKAREMARRSQAKPERKEYQRKWQEEHRDAVRKSWRDSARRRRAADPERFREIARRKYARIKADPARKAKEWTRLRESKRQRYWALGIDERKASNRRRNAARTARVKGDPVLREKRRAYGREYMRRYRALLLADPEAAAAYRAKHAARERARRHGKP